MKEGIHPRYVDCSVTCGCGNTFMTRATVPTLNVEICSNCHPFYTGKQKFVDAAGRVEKFQSRHAWSKEAMDKVLTKKKTVKAKREKVTVGVPRGKKRKEAEAAEEQGKKGKRTAAAAPGKAPATAEASPSGGAQKSGES